MAFQLGEPTVQQYFDTNGDPLVNGTIEFYVTNTTTPATVYSDSIGTAIGTSVTLGSLGQPLNSGTAVALFFDTTVNYKIVRKDASGTEIDPTIEPFFVSAPSVSEAISVLDSPYNAVGDGVTDDTAAIQAAIDAVGSQPVLFPSGYTFLITSLLNVSSGQTMIIRGTIRNTTTGDNGIFAIAEGQFRVKIVGEGLGRLDGPYTGTTPVPTGVYPGGNGAIRINGDYDSTCDDIYIEGLEFRGWGDYGVFAENVERGWVRDCHLQKIGRDGVRTYGCQWFDVSQNVIHNIAPGLSGNAYGVTFTRRPDSVATPLTVNPPTRNCSANMNHVYDVAVWKGLDTHGGQFITFADNIIQDCKIGIGIDEGDTTGQSDAPPQYVKITNNQIDIGSVTTEEGGINVASTSAANPALGIEIEQNTIVGHGGTNRGGIVISYGDGVSIKHNRLYDCAVSGIRITTESIGVEIEANYIRDLTGTIVAAITLEDADSIGTINSGYFHQTTGSYTAISLGTPTAGKGFKFNLAALDYEGTITRFASGHEARIRGDVEVATGTITLESTALTSELDSSGGAVTATLGNGPYPGYMKTIVMTDASNSSTVTVTNHATVDGEVGTFAAVDAYWTLVWTGTEWDNVSSDGVTGI